MQADMHNFSKYINQKEDKNLRKSEINVFFLEIFKLFSKVTHFQSLENLLLLNWSFSNTK